MTKAKLVDESLWLLHYMDLILSISWIDISRTHWHFQMLMRNTVLKNALPAFKQLTSLVLHIPTAHRIWLFQFQRNDRTRSSATCCHWSCLEQGWLLVELDDLQWSLPAQLVLGSVKINLTMIYTLGNYIFFLFKYNYFLTESKPKNTTTSDSVIIVLPITIFKDRRCWWSRC